MSLTFKLKILSSFAQFNTLCLVGIPFQTFFIGLFTLCFDRSNMIAFCKRNA